MFFFSWLSNRCTREREKDTATITRIRQRQRQYNPNNPANSLINIAATKIIFIDVDNTLLLTDQNKANGFAEYTTTAQSNFGYVARDFADPISGFPYGYMGNLYIINKDSIMKLLHDCMQNSCEIIFLTTGAWDSSLVEFLGEEFGIAEFSKFAKIYGPNNMRHWRDSETGLPHRAEKSEWIMEILQLYNLQRTKLGLPEIGPQDTALVDDSKRYKSGCNKQGIEFILARPCHGNHEYLDNMGTWLKGKNNCYVENGEVTGKKMHI